MNLDQFITRLQKLRREQGGDVPVVIDRDGIDGDGIELAEPVIASVVSNGTIAWRRPTNDDSDEVIETVIEIL